MSRFLTAVRFLVVLTLLSGSYGAAAQSEILPHLLLPVLGCRPATGAPGTVITLTGLGLGEGTAVWFRAAVGGAPVAALSFSVAGPNRLRAIVPAGVGTGVVEVSTPEGRVAVAPFSVTTDLVVSSNTTVPAGTYTSLIVLADATATLAGAVRVTGPVRVLSAGALHANGWPLHTATAPLLEAGAVLLTTGETATGTLPPAVAAGN